MHKYIFILLVLFIIACSPTTSPTSPEHTTEEMSVDTSKTVWETYEGILPCADCEGVLTRIHLEKEVGIEGNFNISLIYKKADHDSTFVSSGIYRIRKGFSHLPNKLVYELYAGDAKRRQFYLEENDSTFLLLDKDLQFIPSEHNLRLSLKK